MAPRQSLLVIFFTSFSLLAYEINFTRVLAWAQWHNLAPLVITTAMLGFGISGTAVALAEKRQVSGRYLGPAVFLFPVSLAAGLLVSSQLRFNPYEMGFSPVQVLNLGLYFAFMGLGFFLGATVICFALMRTRICLAYFTNLAGSAAGTLFVLLISFFLHPQDIMGVIVCAALVPSLLLIPGADRKAKCIAGTCLLLTAVSLVAGTWHLDLRRVSQYKPISGALTLPHAEIVHEAYSPLGVVQVVQAEGLRSVPGLSLVSPVRVPVQKMIYFNGAGGSPIIPYRDGSGDAGYLRYLTSFLPFYLAEQNRPDQKRRALIVGAGGGESVLKGILAGFDRIHALEADPNIIRLMTERFAKFSGGIYNHSRVRVIRGEARSFVRRTSDRYDLIDLSLTDGYNASASGVYGLNENYLYTVESVKDYLSCLQGAGMLAFTRWTVTPARDNLKLFATVIRALKQTGVRNPGDHLIAIRSLRTLTLVVAKRSVPGTMIRAVRTFAGERGFDLVFYPGMPDREANRHIRLETPVYHLAVKALLGPDARAFIDNYQFDIRPATDNRPYFHNFFKPDVIEVIRTFGPSQVPVTEWGYLVLIILLIPVLAVSLLLIPAPLVLFKAGFPRQRIGVLVFFALTGAGFFFVEIPMIQTMGLFLGQPIYAVSAIITALLVFSGMGSYVSGRFIRYRSGILTAAALVAGITWTYTLTMDSLFREWLHLSPPFRFGLVLLLTAPLGFFMGIPFPAALALVKERETSLAAWAWGINGFFSVISILSAALIAVVYGFKAVLTMAGAFYLAAGLVSLNLTQKEGPFDD